MTARRGAVGCRRRAACRDACLHGLRDRRERQGALAGSSAKGGIRDYPLQHISSHVAPGCGAIRRLGGLHEFMGWERPDPHRLRRLSGDVTSELSEISEAGVSFRSHIDGSCHQLTPERAVEIQACWGPTFKWCWTSARRFRRAVKWPKPRCCARCAGRPRQGCILEAGRRDGAGPNSALSKAVSTPDLRRNIRSRRSQSSASRATRSAAWRSARGRRRCSRCWTGSFRKCRPERPRYLMGVGKPDDIVGAVMRGIDLFDCVLPTRSGRHGQAFTWDGPINLKNARVCRGLDPSSIRTAIVRPPSSIFQGLSASSRPCRRDALSRSAQLA